MDQVCRLCRKSDTLFLESLFEYRDNSQIAEIVMKVCQIDIEVTDLLPKLICEECLEIVVAAYNLQFLSQESDSFFRASIVMVKSEDFEIQDVKVEALSSDGEEKVYDVEISLEEPPEPPPAKKCQQLNLNSDKSIFNPRVALESKSAPRQNRYYSCNFCEIKLKPRSNILRHMMLVHDPLLKPYACVYCHHRFENENSKDFHERTKHSEADVKATIFCDICGASGNNQIGMDQHKQDDHSVKSKNPESEEESTNESPSKVVRRCRDKFNPRHLPGFEDVKYDERFFACNFCDKQLKPRKNILRHIRLKHDPDHLPHGCRFCVARFKTAESLASHESQHEGEKPCMFFCEICGISGTDKVGMEHHLTDDHHVGETSVEVRPVSHQALTSRVRRKRGDFFNPRPVQGYENLKYDEIFFQCSFCNKQLRPRKNILRHIRFKHDPESLPYWCRFCSERFENSEDLEKHESKTHRNEKPSTLLCDICGVTGDSKRGMDHHMQDDHLRSSDVLEQDFSCLQCNASFKRKESLEQHIRSLHNGSQVKCNKCDEMFSDRRLLQNHVMLAHDKLYRVLTSDEIQQDLRCCACEEEFENDFELLKHCERHRDCDDLGFQELRCIHCPIPVRSFDIFLKHAKYHMKRKTHECLRCRKIFSFDSKFITHVKGHKRQYAKIECETCGSKFRNHRELELHIKVKHEKQTLFICPICAKSMATPTILDNHIKFVHNGEMQKRHECRVCAQKFTHKSKLLRHETTHRTSRPHICEICGAGFKMKEGLTVHIKRHNGTLDKKYPCNQCEYKFTSQHRLQTHLLTHTGAKPNQCEYCDRAYASKGDLVKHLQKLHVGNSVYKCKKCPEAFPRIVELREHQVVHAGRSF